MSKKKSEKAAKEKKQSTKKSAVKPVSEPAVPVETCVVEVKPKARKPKAATGKKVPVEISSEDIALRAYFIAERRAKMGWHGDSTGDWVEAERQLKAEGARKK